MNLAAPSPAPLSAAASFVHGYPFEAWLADRGRATPAEAAALVASLAAQLEAARAVGVTPGLAVPRLVRIDATGAPTLDVWAATRQQTHPEDASAARMRFGPPPGETLDERSDVYVLGVVLYHLLTGRFPCTGSNPVELALAHRHHEVEAPSRIVPGLPEALDALTLSCLAKDPSARPTSLALLADKLTGKLPEPLREPLPPANPAPPLPNVRSATLPSAALPPALAAPAPSRRGGAWPIALAVLAAAAGGWQLASRSTAGRDVTIAAPLATPAVPAAPMPRIAAEPTTSAPTASPAVAAPEPATRAATAAPVTAPPTEPPTRPTPKRSQPEPPSARPRTQPVRAAAPAPASASVVAPPSPAPATTVTPAVPAAHGDHEAEVMRLLAEGDALLRQKKYLGGSEPGALDRYRAVLELAPQHAEAGAKVHLIRTTYLTLARERRDGGDFEAAHRYLSGLDRAFPGDAEITRELLAVDAARADASRTGELTIEVRPWGNVFVDGKFVDQTPMPPLALGAGAHKIEVEGERGRRKSVDVTVHGGEHRRVAIDLESGDG